MRINFIKYGVFFIMIYSIGFSQTVTYYETGEEFVGPFASWKNVKTGYGAKGDGLANDAPAINSALAATKSNSSSSSVLYFPAGTYKLDQTIFTNPGTSTDYQGFTMIGEDPATTVLVWNGSDTGNMFMLDAWYCKVSRLTFDGKGIARRGLVHDGGFSTGCEFSDLVFKDFKESGIRLCLYTAAGQAEHMIMRCRFFRCDVGVYCANWNTLDIWVWHSLFEDCGYGIKGAPGGWQAYYNIFFRSKNWDMNGNTQPCAIVGNTSVNSKRFLGVGLAFVSGNKIYTIDSVNVQGGRTTWIDNVVVNRPGRTYALSVGEGLMVGNTFTLANPLVYATKPYIIDPHTVDPSTVPVPTTVELPATPPKVNRTILEVAKGTGDDAAEIQRLIMFACTSSTGGPKPVVHLPKGGYNAKRTIIVPAGKDFTITGDGKSYGSSIGASFSGGPTIKTISGSRVTIRDISISGNEAIQAEVSDQPESRVLGNQVDIGGGDVNNKANVALLNDGVEHCDMTFAGTGIMSFLSGVVSKGGTILSSGGTTEGHMAFLGGSSSHGQDEWNVQSGGKLIGQAFWYEGDWANTTSLANLTAANSGTITLTSMFWSCAYNMPIVSIANFNGLASFVANKFYHSGGPLHSVQLTGNGQNMKVLYGYGDLEGNPTGQTLWADVWKDQTSPAASAVMTKIAGFPTVINKTMGVTVVPDTQFLRNSLALWRSYHLDKTVERPLGATDIKFIRINVNGAQGTSMRLVAKPARAVSVNNKEQFFKSFSLTGRHPLVENVCVYGQKIVVPAGVGFVKVYTLQGKFLMSANITNCGVVRQTIENIGFLSRRNAVVVRMF